MDRDGMISARDRGISQEGEATALHLCDFDVCGPAPPGSRDNLNPSRLS